MAWPIIGNQPMEAYFKKRLMQILAFCALNTKMHKKLNNTRTAQKAKFFDIAPI